MKLADNSRGNSREENPDELSLTFELDQDNGSHEAYVALNSIAARLRKKFDKASLKPDEGFDSDRLMGYFIKQGMQKFCAELNLAGRKETREGILTDPVSVGATADNLSYLNGALQVYFDDTPSAVALELRTSNGNREVLSRTFEAITAKKMLVAIEASGITIVDIEPPDSLHGGFGFGDSLTGPES